MVGRSPTRLPRRPSLALAAAALAVTGAITALVGCEEPDPGCPGPYVVLRNPSTLACVQRQLASPECPDIPPSPPWPACKHPCEDLRDEATCRSTPGCRVTRELCDVFDDRCEREGPFIGCFPRNLDQAADGDCAPLGAAACATRDDCGSQYLHGPDCPTPGGAARQDGPRCYFTFVTCFDELAPP